MIERLLFHGIYAKTAGTPVGGQDYLLVPAGADEAEPSLPLAQLAKTWTKVALDAAVVKEVPISPGMGIGEGLG
jgi:hypothetical protein|tara:strand:+ start:558 stop:779 length:222 start_codon:yes stop_codon:yes gene_type:complete